MAEPTVVFNVDDFIKQADRLRAAQDQLPFVLANLLNDGAFKTRQVIVNETWPSHVQVRASRFINAALHVDKANKHDLEVSIFDQLGHAHLQAHAKGGTKTVSGPRIAIPNQNVIRLGAHGVRLTDRPKALIARTPKRALRITQSGIFIGRAGKLMMQYLFKPMVRINKDVPFYEDFEYTMRNTVRTGFADAMWHAMATRR